MWGDILKTLSRIHRIWLWAERATLPCKCVCMQEATDATGAVREASYMQQGANGDATNLASVGG